MARFETRITTPDGVEVLADDSEAMAVNQFCEILGNDAIERPPNFPNGTELALHDMERGRVLMRYVVAYG